MKSFGEEIVNGCILFSCFLSLYAERTLIRIPDGTFVPSMVLQQELEGYCLEAAIKRDCARTIVYKETQKKIMYEFYNLTSSSSL